jgi:hypothetical protein
VSYCRFSCDDFASNVYAYSSQHGYVVHVARRRYLVKDLPPPAPEGDIPAFLARHRTVMDIVRDANSEEIDHPKAGEDFTCDTLGELLMILTDLREDGFHVPEAAFKRVQEELAEGT